MFTLNQKNELRIKSCTAKRLLVKVNKLEHWRAKRKAQKWSGHRSNWWETGGVVCSLDEVHGQDAAAVGGRAGFCHVVRSLIDAFVSWREAWRGFYPVMSPPPCIDFPLVSYHQYKESMKRDTQELTFNLVRLTFGGFRADSKWTQCFCRQLYWCMKPGPGGPALIRT